MLALIALLASAAHTATAADAVETALRAEFPDVERWEVEPMDAARAARAADEVTIVRLGARSAVAAGGRLEWFAVRGYRNVVIVTRSLPARADLAAEHVAIKERDVVSAGCEPLTDMDATAGTWTRRALRAGDLLCTDAIEPKPPVVRGSPVSVVHATPRVRVVAVARAEADAALGERVSVRNPKTNVVYEAVVTARNEVRAHE